MTTKSIAIKESLQFGWDTLRANVAFFIKLFVAVLIISLVPAAIIGKLSSAAGPYLGVPLQLLNFIWQAIIGMGVLKIGLKLYDRQPVEIADVWSCVPLTLDYVVVKILFTLIVGIGLLLLIVPGIIWSMQFYLASYLVVDKQTGAINALKGSSKITYGAKWDLGVFASVVLLINIAGIILLGVGLLISIPVTLLAGVYIYRKLLEQTTAGGEVLNLN